MPENVYSQNKELNSINKSSIILIQFSEVWLTLEFHSNKFKYRIFYDIFYIPYCFTDNILKSYTNLLV